MGCAHSKKEEPEPTSPRQPQRARALSVHGAIMLNSGSIDGRRHLPVRRSSNVVPQLMPGQLRLPTNRATGSWVSDHSSLAAQHNHKHMAVPELTTTASSPAQQHLSLSSSSRQKAKAGGSTEETSLGGSSAAAGALTPCSSWNPMLTPTDSSLQRNTSSGHFVLRGSRAVHFDGGRSASSVDNEHGSSGGSDLGGDSVFDSCLETPVMAQLRAAGRNSTATSATPQSLTSPAETSPLRSPIRSPVRALNSFAAASAAKSSPQRRAQSTTANEQFFMLRR
jgi:hypothetical protein